MHRTGGPTVRLTLTSDSKPESSVDKISDIESFRLSIEHHERLQAAQGWSEAATKGIAWVRNKKR